MGEYDYMMALWSQFCPTWSEDETSETLYRTLRDMLPKHQRKQLLRLIDSTNAHREMVSLESFVAGFQLAAGIILAAQVVSAISEKFPYESRKLELREMIAELEPVYLEMENDWRSIQNLKMSNRKIQETIQKYDKKQVEIKRHYFKDDSLPELDKLRLQADEKTEEYFKYFE